MASLAEPLPDRKPALPDAVHRQKAIEPTSLSLTNENANSKARKSSRRSESRRMFCSSQMLRRNTCRSCSAQLRIVPRIRGASADLVFLSGGPEDCLDGRWRFLAWPVIAHREREFVGQTFLPAHQLAWALPDDRVTAPVTH